VFDKGTTNAFLNNYKEIYYGPSVLTFIKHIFQTGWSLLKHKKRGLNNVIYFYGEVDIKNFFFVVWARLLGYKIIIDVVEDLEAFTQFKSFKNRLKYQSAIFFRKRLDLFAHGFTVVSTHLQNKIATSFPDKPIFFFPVTINKYLLQKEGINDNQPLPVVFYSGSFNDKDGLPYLLEALHKIKKEGRIFKFILSGKGSDTEMEKFWNLVTQYALKEEVDYKGFLDRPEYIRILTQEADILCMTRVNSAYANAGFPFKLGEFLATGKPVIASKVGDVPSYLSENDAYLVEPENSDQIKDALNSIFSNPQVAERVGHNGKCAAMKYFDHENYAPALKKFIEEEI
jgi:glycosyltransferase involved in cell wall biosynthesis